MNSPRILMIATSAHTMPSGKLTGLWLDELTTPYVAFRDAGAQVTIGSVAGGEIPIDARSQEGDQPVSVDIARGDAAFTRMLSQSARVDAFKAEDFDAVFLPGGHGTMFDFPGSAALTRLIEDFDRQGKIVSAVCHGPAGLVSAHRADGKPLVAGRRVAGFSNSEEAATGLADDMPFLLETRLRELGGKYESGRNFTPFALRDGNLVTGQNPQSAEMVAALVLIAVRGLKVHA